LVDVIDRFVKWTPEQSEERQERGARFKTQVLNDFKERRLLGRDISEGKIVKDWRFEGLEFKYDFAVKNGRTQVVETLDLAAQSIGRALEKAGAKHIKLEEAKIHFVDEKNEPYQAYVVVNIDPSRPGEYGPALRSLARYGTVLNYCDEVDRRYLLKVMTEAVSSHGNDMSL